jgi:uncharacterized damage-inducible protein DinB
MSQMPDSSSPDTSSPGTSLPEPWLRETLTEVSTVPRAVLHALELARIDLTHWCGDLTTDDLNFSHEGISPIAFHLRHIARSIDRLLTYAEGRPLDPAQIATLKSEAQEGATRDELFAELQSSLDRAASRIRALDATRLNETRTVGIKKLHTTLGGLLVHVADHTQRHTGQAITTAKFIRALRKS